MDFEQIDTLLGDSLESGDITWEGSDFVQIRRVFEDEGDLITAHIYNLSTGDEDDFIIDPTENYPIFRSY